MCQTWQGTLYIRFFIVFSESNKEFKMQDSNSEHTINVTLR